MGARLAGMRPDLGPLGETSIKPGLNALQILESAAANGWDFLYVCGANPATKFPSKLWAEARSKLGLLVVQDLFLTETAQQADVVLPTLSFIEKGGSFVNIENRLQTLFPGKEIPENIYSDGNIFKQLAQKLNFTLALDSIFSEVLNTARLPVTRPEKFEDQELSAEGEKPAGALLATFAHVLFDEGVRMKHDSHLSQMIKEPYARIHPGEGAKRGIQNNDKIRLSVSGNAIVVTMKWDARVAESTVVLPLGFEHQIPVHELGKNLMNGLLIEEIEHVS